MRVLLQTIFVVATSIALAGCMSGPRPFQTQSGLQISILRHGKGPEVVPGDEVEIHEIASLTNGEVVFSTYKQGEPRRFCQGKGIVIKGIDEAVLGMKVGETRTVIVPPHLSRRGYNFEKLLPEARNRLLERRSGKWLYKSEKFGPEDTLHVKIDLVRIVGRPCNRGPRPFQTQSGLQISILRQGKGPEVVPGAEVEIHEITSLIKGEMVFSTYKQYRPFRFCQGKGIVIKGVDEAVLGMKAGEIRAVIVPPHLHERGDSKKYAAEDSLHYRLELVRIVGSTCNKPSKL